MWAQWSPKRPSSVLRHLGAAVKRPSEEDAPGLASFDARHQRAPLDDGTQADGAARPFAYRRPVGGDRASLSLSAPFAAQLRPIVQALSDLALKTALGRIIE